MHKITWYRIKKQINIQYQKPIIIQYQKEYNHIVPKSKLLYSIKKHIIIQYQKANYYTVPKII